jgi:hypothetical protein
LLYLWEFIDFKLVELLQRMATSIDDALEIVDSPETSVDDIAKPDSPEKIR